MKVALLFLLTAAGFVACKGKEQNPAVTAEITNNTTGKEDDSTQIRKVITDFYNWYSRNYEKLMAYQLYSSLKKKEAPPYKINWDEVARYQAFIRDSVPQLGREFLANQEKMLQQCDSAFKVDLEDDIPYGFDYDWYTNSQEDPQYYTDEINKPHEWRVRVTGEYAKVDINGEFLTYDKGTEKKASAVILSLQLKKENNKWTIAGIGNE